MAPAGDTCDSDTFGQFLARVQDVFPVRRQAAWSHVQQVVFNGLLARAIQRHGHAGLNRELLEELAHDMERILRLYHDGPGPGRDGHGES